MLLIMVLTATNVFSRKDRKKSYQKKPSRVQVFRNSDKRKCQLQRIEVERKLDRWLCYDNTSCMQKEINQQKPLYGNILLFRWFICSSLSYPPSTPKGCCHHDEIVLRLLYIFLPLLFFNLKTLHLQMVKTFKSSGIRTINRRPRLTALKCSQFCGTYA